MLGVRGQQHHRGDASNSQLLSGADPIELGHTNIHDDEIGTQSVSKLDRLTAVARLTDNVISEMRQHLAQIHTNERLIVCDDNARAWG